MPGNKKGHLNYLRTYKGEKGDGGGTHKNKGDLIPISAQDGWGKKKKPKWGKLAA